MRRTPRILLSGALAFAVTSIAPANALALATFDVVITDPADLGFNDPTPATPVGGNTGTTVGEQRKIAFDYALDMWARVLESDVPIVVSVGFAPFECVDGFAPLGHAGPASVEFDVTGMDPYVILPEALADQIAGIDLEPGTPDIEAEFNGGIADCIAGYDWYYGLDRMAPRNNADLVQVVLHEIAHGLGFTTFVDPESGEDLAPGYTDPFSSFLFDLATEKHWPEMTPEERVISASTPRGLVWDGQYAMDAASMILQRGAPHVTTMPEVPGFSDLVIDGNFGPRLTQPIRGSVAAPTPANACDYVTGVSGAIAIAVGDTCHPMDIAAFTAEAGAIAALVTTQRLPPDNFDVPDEDLSTIPPSIPALGISQADSDLLLAASGVLVTLSADMNQLTGADPEGRIYIYASSPIRSASTASHFDPITRPDLTMEPAESPNARHDITVDRAALRDMGWRTLCGNSTLDAGEECDAGAANSDTVADACRTTCRLASCGDGVVDALEMCDPGDGPGADPMCTPTCTRPVCGNGVVELDEECDMGASNSDSAPNACRTTCETASCGDGVVDSGEACDDMLTPATCRTCMVLSTGSGGSAGSAATGGAAGSTGASGKSGASGIVNNDDDDDDGDDDSGGCGCRVTPSRATSSGYALLLAALVLGARRRTSRGC